MQPLRFLHIAQQQPDPRIWTTPFLQALSAIGTLTLVPNGAALPDSEKCALAREADIVLGGWNGAMLPAAIAADPGRLRYACNITGELTKFFPIEFLDAGILMSNWGDYPANRVAEGAMALLLATLKDIHFQTEHVRAGGWKMDMHFHGGSLEGAIVAIYGLGVIGRRFLELIAPFRARLRVFDPYLRENPEGVERVHSLEELLEGAQILVIHAALTPETRNSINAQLLAKLPRHGVVINTARGGIIDQDALFRELETGRLRAGLDVLEPDSLPEDHPARRWPNLILTAHRVDHGWPDFNEPPTTLNQMQRICLDNIERFRRGEQPRFLFDRERYLRST